MAAPEDHTEASPQYRVLRSGKHILTTPGLKKAARIAIMPATLMTKQAARVAMEQVCDCLHPPLMHKATHSSRATQAAKHAGW
jgi:hypothetical protein